MGENSDARQLQKSQRADPAPQSSSLVLRGLNLSVVMKAQSLALAELPLPVLVGHQGAVTSLAFSNSGKLIASGGLDKTVRIWSIETGNEIKSFQHHENKVVKVRFTQNDKFVLSADESGILNLYDIENGQGVMRISFGESSFLDFGISEDGEFLLVPTTFGWIRKWQMASTREIELIHIDVGWLDKIHIANDCSMAAIGRHNSGIALVDLSNDDLGETKWIENNDFINSLVLTSDNSSLLWISANNDLKAYDLNNDSLHFKVDLDGGSFPFKADVDESQTQNLDWDLQDDWDELPPIGVDSMEDPQDIFPGVETFESVDDEAYPVISNLLAVSQDNSVIIVDSRNTIKTFSFDGILITGKYDGHASPVTSFAISTDSEIIGAGAQDGTIRLWKSQFTHKGSSSGRVVNASQSVNSTAQWSQLSEKKVSVVSSEEYKIFSAALEHYLLDSEEPKIAICDRTAPPNFGLSGQFGNWDESGDDAERQSTLERLRASSAPSSSHTPNDTKLTRELFASFRTRNKKSLPLEEKVRISIDYTFVQLEDFASDWYGFAGGEAEWNWKKPQPAEEFTALLGFSRIGFSQSGSQALLHLIVHGYQSFMTEYIFLEKVRDEWHVLHEIPILSEQWLV